jgi:hypothetical protein
MTTAATTAPSRFCPFRFVSSWTTAAASSSAATSIDDSIGSTDCGLGSGGTIV